MNVASYCLAAKLGTRVRAPSGRIKVSATRRIVLRSMPVRCAIWRWTASPASGVATVVRLFSFKTFPLHAPPRLLTGEAMSRERDCRPLTSRYGGIRRSGGVATRQGGPGLQGLNRAYRY